MDSEIETVSTSKLLLIHKIPVAQTYKTETPPSCFITVTKDAANKSIFKILNKPKCHSKELRSPKSGREIYAGSVILG